MCNHFLVTVVSDIDRQLSSTFWPYFLNSGAVPILSTVVFDKLYVLYLKTVDGIQSYPQINDILLISFILQFRGRLSLKTTSLQNNNDDNFIPGKTIFILRRDPVLVNRR